MPTKRGYAASRAELITRLARIEGQVRGVARMVEDDRDCIDVMTQISAIQAALHKVGLGLLDGHARVCIAQDQKADQVDEMMGAVGRMFGR